ncbi:MAG TPA: HAD family phosphatase [Actinomycetes bacterium]|nr:HAD family phosphatase [Actinomycetes bacterium]
MDGVIVDSEAARERATVDYLAARGVEAEPELFAAMMGRRVREMAESLAPLVRRSPAETLADLEAAYWRLAEERVEPMPKLREALDRLAGAGLPLAVATSGTRAYVEHVLGRLGVREAFAAVVSGEDVERGKPHPDVYLLAAERLAADPADCVAIEDAPHGIAAARAAGMRVVAVPHALVAGLDFSAADVVVGDLAQAAEWILSRSA